MSQWRVAQPPHFTQNLLVCMRKGSAIVRSFARKSFSAVLVISGGCRQYADTYRERRLSIPRGERYSSRCIVYLTRYAASEAARRGKLQNEHGVQSLFEKDFGWFNSNSANQKCKVCFGVV
ncbi:MAG TPA: hypothetical protein VFM18_16820 [Methanosarcina sp.]|nr:hypothetical protein [Methanosarcina sp.]